MSQQPTIRVIATPDDLGEWHQYLSEEGMVGAIVDDHKNPRLMSEGEDGVMYVTDPYEEGEPFWTKALVDLWAYGPFTVVWPAALSEPSPVGEGS